MHKLRRYWFEFNFPDADVPYGMGLGCGITAWNYEDALQILKNNAFPEKPLPPIKKTIEDVDVSTLDAGHVLLNMLPPNVRGIWYPLGFKF